MNKKVILGIAALSAACMAFTACSGAYNDGEYFFPGGSTTAPSTPDSPDGDAPNFVYGDIVEQGFKNVADEPSSYFSLDKNTASYSQVRYQLNNGWQIDPKSVRVEELINYFDYDFAAPEEKAVGMSTYLSDCPWNDDNKLMMVGLKTVEYDITAENANYVFLLDVSGSMSGDSRLGLAKKGINYLLDGLGENDLVSLVTYASGTDTVLDGVECTESGKTNIRNKVSKLVASGATYGESGLHRAYEIAQKHLISGGNNRIVLISDGDFNVGINNVDDMKELIQDKARGGVYLSVLGVGMGNMRDDMLETLATCGNGNYAYLDSETEARKVFCENLGGMLRTVAKDAKAGVTFTENVEKYRLIGYDTKIISEDDFNNENADTGELGSNLCVVALYEIALSEGADGKLADAEVRYKDVTGEQFSDSVTAEITLDTPSSDDLSFVACVAEFGLIIRQSQYKGSASYASVLQRLSQMTGYVNGDIYKQEFVTLVGKASETQTSKAR